MGFRKLVYKPKRGRGSSDDPAPVIEAIQQNWDEISQLFKEASDEEKMEFTR